MLEVNLSNELVLTLVGGENGEHVIFASRNESSLIAGYSGAFSSMSLNHELKVALLIPNMDTAIGSTGVANTIFIINSGIHLGLLELSSEGTILEQFLTAISWIPKLERPGSHGDEFEVICFSRPLNVVDGV